MPCPRLGVSRSARFWPANACLETTCRYSSFLRKSFSKRRAMGGRTREMGQSVNAAMRQLVRRQALHCPIASLPLSLGGDAPEQLIDDGVGVHLVCLALEVEKQPVSERGQGP